MARGLAVEGIDLVLGHLLDEDRVHDIAPFVSLVVRAVGASLSAVLAPAIARFGDPGVDACVIFDGLPVRLRPRTVRGVRQAGSRGGILVTGSETTTSGVYRTLLDNAQNGAIPRATLRASYDRILVLKAGL